jgi:hypothetical protein
MGRFVTLKKMGYPVFCQKAVCKKPNHCYPKKEKAAWSLLLFNNNDPVFCTLLFGKKQGT